MTLEAVGIIAEVIGAAAVVVSLLYLATQIKHASIIDKANTRTELTSVSQNILFNGTVHAEIMVKATAGESLTDAERMTLTLFNRAVFRGFENYVYQRRVGLFDESEWNGIHTGIKNTLAKTYAQEDWRAVREQYSDLLRETLDPMVPDVDDKAQATRLVYPGGTNNAT